MAIKVAVNTMRMTATSRRNLRSIIGTVPHFPRKGSTQLTMYRLTGSRTDVQAPPEQVLERAGQPCCHRGRSAGALLKLAITVSTMTVRRYRWRPARLTWNQSGRRHLAKLTPRCGPPTGQRVLRELEHNSRAWHRTAIIDTVAHRPTRRFLPDCRRCTSVRSLSRHRGPIARKAGV